MSKALVIQSNSSADSQPESQHRRTAFCFFLSLADTPLYRGEESVRRKREKVADKRPDITPALFAIGSGRFLRTPGQRADKVSDTL